MMATLAFNELRSKHFDYTETNYKWTLWVHRTRQKNIFTFPLVFCAVIFEETD